MTIEFETIHARCAMDKAHLWSIIKGHRSEIKRQGPEAFMIELPLPILLDLFVKAYELKQHRLSSLNAGYLTGLTKAHIENMRSHGMEPFEIAAILGMSTETVQNVCARVDARAKDLAHAF